MLPDAGGGSILLVDGFDRHDVSPATLTEQADAVAKPAGDVERFNADLTAKHNTARQGVAGVIATAMEGADAPTKNQARQLIQGATVAAGALRGFATAVETFNGTIDGLNAQIRSQPTKEEQLARRAALSGQHTAAIADLQAAARTAKQQLSDPLDPAHVKALYAAGALPSYAPSMFSNITDLTVVPLDCLPFDLLKKFVDEWGGLGPPGSDDPVSLSLYGLGLLGFATDSTISWMTTVRLGGFGPRDAAGRFRKISTMSFFDRLRAGAGRFPTRQGLTRWERLKGFDPEGNWKAKGWRGAQRGAWDTAGKWATRAGVVVTAATSAWDEWQQDASYPDDERAGRAVTKGASTAAGAWAGAEVGAWAGGAIGTAICPGVGTVIGAGVGGLIGGFAGSQAGAWVGDQLKDAGGWVGDHVGDAVSDGWEAAKDLGDKISFWD